MPVTISTNLFTPSGIATVWSSLTGSAFSSHERCAGARAIIRHGQHSTDHFSTRNPGGLHPMYLDIHGKGNAMREELDDIKDVLKDSRADVFDAITTLDRIDGGISILLHCPGFQTGAKASTGQLTIDVVIPPRELAEGGKQLSRVVALMVQSFGHDVALPYLQRFSKRCAVEGVKALPAPSPGNMLKLDGASHLPAAVVQGGTYIRCRCRPGRPSDFTQDIAFQEKLQPKLLPPSSDAVEISDENTDDLRTGAAKPTAANAPAASQISRSQPRHSAVDGYHGVIVSIGPQTDVVLDRFKLDDALIPRLRKLTQTVRSSRWEQSLRDCYWGLSYEQAVNLSRAMQADVGGDPQTQEPKTKFGSTLSAPVVFLLLLLFFAIFVLK